MKCQPQLLAGIIAVCQGFSLRTEYWITIHASNQSKHRLGTVKHYCLLMFCSLALWLAAISLYITWDGNVLNEWLDVGLACFVAESLVNISIAAYVFACRTAVVFWLRGSCVWRVGQLPRWATVIDTWGSDWILSPVSDVWQPTPSLLITSFTLATGHLCLGPDNTEFFLRRVFGAQTDVEAQFTACARCSVVFHTSVLVPVCLNFMVNITCCCALLLIHNSFSHILNAVHPVYGHTCVCFNLLCEGGEWQMIDSTRSSQFRSGSYMSPQLHIKLCW